MKRKTSINLPEQPKTYLPPVWLSYRDLGPMKRLQPSSLRFHVSSSVDHMAIGLAPALNVEPHNLIRGFFVYGSWMS